MTSKCVNKSQKNVKGCNDVMYYWAQNHRIGLPVIIFDGKQFEGIDDYCVQEVTKKLIISIQVF